jgi:hypothetical protein
VPRSSKWFLPFQFSNQNIVYISHSPHPCYMPCTFMLLDLTTVTVLGVVYKLSFLYGITLPSRNMFYRLTSIYCQSQE